MSEEKRGPGRPPKKDAVQCVVLRDFWPEEGNRVVKGTVVEMTPDQAMDGIEAGAVRRLKKGDCGGS